MTTTDVRTAGTDQDSLDSEPTVHSGRRRWIVVACVVAVLAVTLGYLVGNEIQANTQFDQAHRALDVTRQQITVATIDLTSVQRSLATVDGQVSVDSTTLADDVSKLDGAKSALSTAQADVARQASTETALHTCLGGVEQALNALSVGDQARAINALNAVATSCTSAGVDVG
jgi:hypothetical protein